MFGVRQLLAAMRPIGARHLVPATLIGGAGAYIAVHIERSNSFAGMTTSNLNRTFAAFHPLSTSVLTAKADGKYKCQEMVIEQDKHNGLFLILHLDPKAPAKECVAALQKIKAHIDRISPLDLRDEENEILVGVAFGPEFLAKVYPDATKNGVESFVFNERRGKGSSMPATGGDIFIHATSGEKGKLFELAQAVLADMPEKSIKQVEEVYGFVYRGGRDLSGFIDGTENPAEEDERIEVAQSEKTGGSYVLTQRWLHDLKKIRTEKTKVMEERIGRTQEDSIEIKPVVPTSHVGRMTHGLSDSEAEEKRIVRHSLPYGTASGECGLFFIAYAKTPKTLDWMLDRMTGSVHGGDNVEDALFHFTRPLTGAYFYSPSKQELESIYRNVGRASGMKFGLFK